MQRRFNEVIFGHGRQLFGLGAIQHTLSSRLEF